MLRLNPLASIGLGVLLIVLSIVIPGPTRDLILRLVGGLAILAGVVGWFVTRRR